MEKILNELCLLIKENCALKKIILYGIKRHPITENIKDINLCVVVNEDPKEAERRLCSAIDFDFPINLLLYGENDFQKLICDKTSYAHSIVNKGTVLYG